MNIDEFMISPVQKEHEAYKNAFFVMKPAPEYATGEVVISSLYRNVGYKELAERKVPSLGTQFFNRIKSPPKTLQNRSNSLSSRAWYCIVDQILKSPKQPNQSKKRFLQINPLVPETALYTSSARLRGNSWNPGALIKRLLAYGCDDSNRAIKLWKDIFDKLSVADDDDIWAQFISKEIQNWNPPSIEYKWEHVPFDYEILPDDVKSLKIPARQFVQDLENVLNLKESLNRRQWISLIESILRIGTTSHVMWICCIHDVIWKKITNALNGESDCKDVANDLSMPTQGFWVHGSKALPLLRDIVRNYYIARIGINLILHTLCEKGIEVDDKSLTSTYGIKSIIETIENTTIDSSKFWDRFHEILDKEPRQLACSKGVPGNIYEFLRYALGKRQTAEGELRNYDQGYFLRKRGSYSASPWIVSMGPVSVIALVHCCTALSPTPKTVVDFCEHLGNYGIYINANNVPSSELGSTLRNLGLVVDSPDAEGGMIVTSPFQTINDTLS